MGAAHVLAGQRRFAPSVEEDKNIVRRYQATYNANKLDNLDDLVAPDVLTPKIMPGLPPGIEAAKTVRRASRLRMPAFHTAIDELVAEGDKVVARVAMTGTHTGEIWGMPATGQGAEFTGMYMVRIAGGKIVKHRPRRIASACYIKLGSCPGQCENRPPLEAPADRRRSHDGPPVARL